MTVWQTGKAPAVFAVVFALAQLSDAIGVPVAFCVSKAWLGIPCPGCGITTSVNALLRGRLQDAFDANAAGPLVAAFVIAQLLLMLAAGRKVLSELAIRRLSRLNDHALATVLVAAWLIHFT